MPDEKIEQLLTEFYELKKEITSGDISIKRNYLLFRKYILMQKLYDKYRAEQNSKKSKESFKRKRECVLAIIVFYPLLIVNPFVIFLLGYYLDSKKKERIASDKEYEVELAEARLIKNVGELINNKLKHHLLELTKEQTDALDREAGSTDAKELLTPDIYGMLVDNYSIDQTSIGEVEDQIKSQNQVRELTIKTNH